MAKEKIERLQKELADLCTKEKISYVLMTGQLDGNEYDWTILVGGNPHAITTALAGVTDHHKKEMLKSRDNTKLN